MTIQNRIYYATDLTVFPILLPILKLIYVKFAHPNWQDNILPKSAKNTALYDKYWEKYGDFNLNC